MIFDARKMASWYFENSYNCTEREFETLVEMFDKSYRAGLGAAAKCIVKDGNPEVALQKICTIIARIGQEPTEGKGPTDKCSHNYPPEDGPDCPVCGHFPQEPPK